MAQGSIFELKTQIVVVRRLGIGDRSVLDETEPLAEEVSKMLASFIEKLRESRALKADS